MMRALDKKISLAPLRGVTLAPFRSLLAQRFGGVDEALAPFIALGGPARPKPKMLTDVLPEACAPLTTVPQVIGKDPVALRYMAEALRDLGYSKLNLNCGCPWKFVAKKGRGSGLPEIRDNFLKMLEAGCSSMPNGFSIKIRLGYKSETTLLSLVDEINQFPLTEITIHPRTGEQMYEGEVHLDRFREVFPLLKVPVVYNGDIFTAEDAEKICSEFSSLAGIMIGRGLCQNPLLAEQIKGLPASSDIAPKQRILDFAMCLQEQYAAQLCGPAPLMGRLKELWSYLHKSFEHGDEGLRKIQRAASLPELLAAIDSLVS